MSQYNAPANIDDFTHTKDPATSAAGWDAQVRRWLSNAGADDGGSFYNHLDVGGDVVPIPWDAFPLALRTWYQAAADPDAARQEAAETLKPWMPGGEAPRRYKEGRLGEPFTLLRRQQDEYCEWHTYRENGRITRVDFTCEGPEYWDHLAAEDFDVVLDAYRKHVSPDVQPEDLMYPEDVVVLDDGSWTLFGVKDTYNGLNKWNTTHGAMHLTHEANTLGAEVRLAADATVLRGEPGDLLDAAGPLICCAGFGGATRSSDPSIGLGVHRVVAAGDRVALADPIGLYISVLNEAAFTDFDGNPVDCWRVTRGTEAGPHPRILRATFTPPSDDAVYVGGVELTHGGQIADYVQMVLYGATVHRAEGDPAPQPQPCGNACCTHPDHPGFKVAVPIGVDCSRLRWTQFAPLGPGDPEAVEPAAAAAIQEDALAGTSVPDPPPFPPRSR
ncbi:MAG: hypothetical protein LC798_05865 [Chloroflexi bacterium]|nr:hypothetical protein [Chloroflexota bacterium]